MGLSKMIRDDELAVRKAKGLVCKGLLFKGYSSEYYKDGEIGRREGLRLLKRKSCKGHPDCDSYDKEKNNILECFCDYWFLEEMAEMIEHECVVFPPIEDGVLYRVRVVNESYDYESGYCDGFDFEFYKVEEDDNKKNGKS